MTGLSRVTSALMNRGTMLTREKSRAFVASALAALAALASLGGTPSAQAAEAGGTWMVGDSITVLGTPALRYHRPDWEINAARGRPVGDLKALVRQRFSLLERLARGTPATLVIALGTNATLGWTADDYREAVRMVPARTTVVFVTTYRDGQAYALEGRYSQRPELQTHYSAWMRQVAGERPRTCLVEWRRKVMAHPELLRDGTHPNARGQRVWAAMVATTTRECTAG